jgi:Asp-tRNA(Asn)/Glu-tRNA(Gln) amidotransferase C subunit
MSATGFKMIFDQALLQKLATLSSLSLLESEEKLFVENLKNILTYFNQMQKVEISREKQEKISAFLEEQKSQTLGIESIEEDTIIPFSPSDQKPKVLESAPVLIHDGFSVPPLLPQESL